MMDGIDERSSKRRKLEASHFQPQPIQHANQLGELLRFRQSIGPETKSNINHFKDFLSGINRNEDFASQARQLQILRKYCSDQTAASKDELDFPDLLLTWSFAVQANNDAICSAIPATLAQFFRTISGILEFREFGLSLCHSLMKRDQVKLFDRGLSASKSKEHLISPCLRLLTEVVSFDGGTLSNHVFSRRDVLYKRLDVLLTHTSIEEETDRRRPTARRMVLRLMIANFKFLDTVAKSEFITHLKIIQACIRGLINDGDDIVVDVIQSINTGIVEDSAVSRSSKLRFFNANVLTAFASLYDYEPDVNHVDAEIRVRQVLQTLLSKVCATRKGTILSQHGWYPLGSNNHIYNATSEDFIDLGLDSPLYFDDYNTTVPVKNTALSTFVQSLKPEADTLQAELMVQIFKAVPELVADYFSKKASFTITSGDDALFRGHFAFLFSVSQLPVPKQLGLNDSQPQQPPPVSIIIESLLPRPFDRTALTRCFTLNDEILILSGARLLTVALDKLDQILKLFASITENRQMWDQAATRLVEAVLTRAPRFKDITDTVHRFSTTNEVTRSALFECIATYYQILPEATAGSKFDIAPILLDKLSHAQKDSASETSDQENVEQILSLIKIAKLAPTTRWFQKSGVDDLSLFGTLLKFAAGDLSDDAPKQIASVLTLKMNTAGLTGSSSSFLALQQSLKPSKKFVAGQEIYLFVDNSVHRAVQKPVKYLDHIELTQQSASDKKPLSLIACSVAEQWGYAVKKYAGQKEILKNIADWIARFFSALEFAGENFRVMIQFQEEMSMAIEDNKAKGYLQKSFEKIQKKPLHHDDGDDKILATSNGIFDSTKDVTQTTKNTHIDLSQIFGTPIPAPTNLDGTDKWDTKTDIETAIHSGRVTKLIRSTSSIEEEIRLQAFQLLQTFNHILDTSTHPEKSQIHLLTSELIETIRHHGLKYPFPSPATELACSLLEILNNPDHRIYGKANRFLLRSPTWDLSKLIQHWTDKILFREPESDDPGSSIEETEWFLTWLINGLKTPSDMEMYRRSGIFEKLLALYSNPGLVRSTKKMILTLVWRAICIEGGGGADTLITRYGLDRWLEVVGLVDSDQRPILEELGKRLVEASDSVVIERWKSMRKM